MSKPNSNSSNPNMPALTNNNIPKFTPGSTPKGPSTYEEITREMSNKSQPSVTPKAAAAKPVPTLLDYATKDGTPQGNKNSNASELASVSSASAGLSLLASSAVNQKYMDKSAERSWDHVVSDIIKTSLSPKKSEIPVGTPKASDSFLDQFQKYAMLHQQGTKDTPNVPDSTKDKKSQMSNLLMQTKNLNQQQLMKFRQQIQANILQNTDKQSAKDPWKHTVKMSAPPAHSKPASVATSSLGSKPKAGGSLLSNEDMYRRFLQESGISIPPSQPKLPSSQNLPKPNIGQVRPQSSGVPKSAMSLLNTQSHTVTPSGIKVSASASKPQKSVLDFSSNSSQPQGSHSNIQRTSPGSQGQGQMPRPGQVTFQGQGNHSNSGSSTDMLQQLIMGKSDGHPVNMHSYSKQPSPSSLLNKSVSPSSLQNKSGSPSSIYGGNKSMSPTAQGKSQNSVWSVASMAQGSSQKSSASLFSTPHAPQVHKPVPGYQSLKLGSFPRETSPSSLPQSQVTPHLPSPDILSPLGE